MTSMTAAVMLMSSTAAATCTFREGLVSTADLSTYNFDFADVSATSAFLVFGSMGGTTASITSATINLAGGGTVAGTSAISAANSPTTIGIFAFNLAGGTIASIDVVLNAAAARAWAVLYTAEGVNSLTATDTATDITGDPLDLDIDCNAGGFIIAGACANNAASDITWVNLTERYDNTAETAPLGSAMDNFASAQTALAVDADMPGTPSAQAAAAAAFR